MQSLEFLTLARELGISQDEANLRSAASRAYYAGFHFASERLEQLTAGSSVPFIWTGVRKGHLALRAQWRDQQDVGGHTIANFLFLAHELRKKADYDLELVFTSEDSETTFRFVELAIQMAETAR